MEPEQLKIKYGVKDRRTPEVRRTTGE